MLRLATIYTLFVLYGTTIPFNFTSSPGTRS